MAAKFTADSIKKITAEDMKKFILDNYPEEKGWFKTVAYQNKDGKPTIKYNHLNAVREFCKKFAPELIPVAKEKEEPKTKFLEDW